VTIMDDKMLQAINDQINAELYSGYLYVSMAAYFDALNLPGFANWMKVQELEERFHAFKFYDYVNGRGGRVTLKAIEGPPTQWDSPLAAFEHVLRHEQMVTGRINALVDLAADLKDHATYNFLQWYVSEQVEEESNATALIAKLKLIGDSGQGLLMLDKELAVRVFTPPAAEAAAP